MSEETAGSAESGNPAAGSASGGTAEQPSGNQQSAAQQLSQPPASPAAGDTGAPPQPQQPQSWIDQHVSDPDVKSWLQAKGFDKANPEAVAKSYHNLEKLFGADKAERTVMLPSADASAEERMEVFNKLGRPETPDKYDVPFGENADANFVGWAKGAFHEAGLTADQARTVAEKFNEFTQQSIEQQQGQYHQSVEAEDGQLRQEWGKNYDRNVAKAQHAARNLLPGDEASRTETLDKLEQAMGYKGLLQFMQGLGEKLSEDSFVDGSVQSGSASKARIQQLEADPAFMKRYMRGDTEAVATMRRLYQEMTDG